VNVNNDVLQWQGFDAEISIDSTFNHIKTDAIISPILFTTTQGTVLDTAQMHLITTLSREKNQPWTGEHLLSIPTFYLKDTTGAVLRFDHLRLVSNSAIIAHLLNATLNLEVDNIEFANEIVDKLHLNIAFNNLASTPLFALSQAIDKTDAATLPHVLDLISQTFGEGGNVFVDYRINAHQEQMLLSVMMDFPMLQNKQIQALLLGTHAQVILDIPNDLMHETIITHTIGQHLSALQNAGMLIAENNAYHMEIDYNQGKFMLNKKLVPPEQILGLIILLMQGHSHASITH
jgi:uncharacterized protein YdgA (DUF945 family)